MNDVFRKSYRELNNEEKANMEVLKRAGDGLYKILDDFADSREISLAKTKLEESIMWAVKHITK